MLLKRGDQDMDRVISRLVWIGRLLIQNIRSPGLSAYMYVV